MAKYTKADYVEVAPYIMSIGDFSATAIETKLSAIPEAPEKPEPPEPTKANIVALFNEVYSTPSVREVIQKNGGLMSTASKYDMTMAQCKQCLREFAEMEKLFNTPKA